MFDITDGFDIVIGNPPYGVSIKGESRVKIINFLGRVPDYEIYYYFIEVSKIFLKRNGIKLSIMVKSFCLIEKYLSLPSPYLLYHQQKIIIFPFLLCH